MQDFSSAVNNAMQSMIDSGKVEEIIKAKLEKTVEEAINDALKSYSDFGKELSSHVKNSLKVEVSNVNLQEYGKTVMGLVEGLVNKHVQANARGHLLSQLEELFDTPPERISLQDLIDNFKSDEEDEACRDSIERMGLVIEESNYGYVYVGFNPSADKEKYGGYSSTKERISKVNECEIQLHFNKPKGTDKEYTLKWISFGGHRGESTKEFLPTCLHGTARRLFQMYCAGTKIIIDTLDDGDYETYYNWHD